MIRIAPKSVHSNDKSVEAHIIRIDAVNIAVLLAILPLLFSCVLSHSVVFGRRIWFLLHSHICPCTCRRFGYGFAEYRQYMISFQCRNYIQVRSILVANIRRTSCHFGSFYLGTFAIAFNQAANKPLLLYRWYSGSSNSETLVNSLAEEINLSLSTSTYLHGKYWLSGIFVVALSE